MEQPSPQQVVPDPAVLAELEETTPPPPADPPDPKAWNEADYLEMSPTQRHAADVLAFRKYQNEHITSIRAERDEWKRRHDEIQPKALAFERLDDRRGIAWVTGVLAALTGAAGSVAAIFADNETVRIISGSVAAVAGLVMIVVVLVNARKARL